MNKEPIKNKKPNSNFPKKEYHPIQTKAFINKLILLDIDENNFEIDPNQKDLELFYIVKENIDETLPKNEQPYSASYQLQERSWTNKDKEKITKNFIIVKPTAAITVLPPKDVQFKEWWFEPQFTIESQSPTKKNFIIVKPYKVEDQEYFKLFAKENKDVINLKTFLEKEKKLLLSKKIS